MSSRVTSRVVEIGYRLDTDYHLLRLSCGHTTEIDGNSLGRAWPILPRVGTDVACQKCRIALPIKNHAKTEPSWL